LHEDLLNHFPAIVGPAIAEQNLERGAINLEGSASTPGADLRGGALGAEAPPLPILT